MAEKGVDLDVLNEYPGTGPVSGPEAQFFAKNTATGKGYRVPADRMPGGGGSGGGVTPDQLRDAQTLLLFSTVTANYTLQLSDLGTVVRVNSASDVTLTLPANATTALPLGAHCEIRQIGAGRVTVVGESGVTIGVYPAGATRTAGQHASVFVHKVALNTYNLANAVQ